MSKDNVKKYQMDMCNGPILKKMLIFAIPLVCSSLLQLLFNAVDVIAAGMIRFSYVGVFYVLCGIMEVMVGSLRGMGYAVFPMIVSLVGSCALRIVWIQTVFQIDRFHNIDTVYVIYPISWIVTAIAHIITYIVVKRKLINV